MGSDYGGVNRERRVDQVVVNHGTLPLDELYFELKPQSVNEGAGQLYGAACGSANRVAHQHRRAVSNYSALAMPCPPAIPTLPSLMRCVCA